MALAGFEWLVVDLEHTAIDLQTAENLIRTIQGNKMNALVRVSKNEEVIIKSSRHGCRRNNSSNGLYKR